MSYEPEVVSPDFLNDLTREELLEIILRQEADNRNLQVSKIRGYRWWPEDLFCPQCDGPYLIWNGHQTICILCGR